MRAIHRHLPGGGGSYKCLNWESWRLFAVIQALMEKALGNILVVLVSELSIVFRAFGVYLVGPSKVLLLIDRLGRGGAAQVVLNIAVALNREEFSPIVCTTRRAPANGQDEILREAGVPLIELNRHRRWQFRSWRPLWQVLPTVSILHSHESGSNFWGRLWGQLFRVPIIITQDHTAADEKRWIGHFVDRIMSSLSDRIVTVSQFDRDLSIRFEKLPPDKVMTIYNGINVDRFAFEFDRRETRWRVGVADDKWLLAIIGRLTAQKNHQSLFEALTLLPASLRSRIHCLVIGGGELEDRLRDKVHRLGLNNVVSFLGERTDVPTILRMIDLLVLPSHWECLPMVLLEALAAKCPIVATKVGGVPEVLGGLGWPLVSPKDSKSLARAIASVLQMSNAERNHIGEAGRQIVVEKFSIERSVIQVESLYHSLLSKIPGVNGCKHWSQR